MEIGDFVATKKVKTRSPVLVLVGLLVLAYSYAGFLIATPMDSFPAFMVLAFSLFLLNLSVVAIVSGLMKLER